MRKRYITGELLQKHGLWFFGSVRHQTVKSQGIGYWW